MNLFFFVGNFFKSTNSTFGKKADPGLSGRTMCEYLPLLAFTNVSRAGVADAKITE